MQRLLFVTAVAITSLLAPVHARADEERFPLSVEVGATVKQKVGFAMGHLCDDETLVRAEMQNGTDEDNVLVVTGLKAGTTLCRAGMVKDRPTFLFEVTVTSAPAPARKPAPPKPPRR